MKTILLALLVLGLHSEQLFADPQQRSQGRPQIENPGEFRGGPDRGGQGYRQGPGSSQKELTYLRETVTAHEQTISEITNAVVSANPAVTGRKRQQVSKLQADLKTCAMYDEAFKAKCLRDNSLALVKVALTPEVSNTPVPCTGIAKLDTTSSTAGVWDGRGEYLCSVSHNDRFELVHTKAELFVLTGSTELSGYQIKITSGACVGKTGYLYEGYASLHTCKNNY